MSEVLTEGLTVMLIGMGTVLTFLCIMIFSMVIMSKIVIYLNKIFPEAVEAVKKPVLASSDAEVAAAVAAAFSRK